MLSSNAGISGVSGDLSLGTGIATARFDRLHDGHSGAISITTGKTRGIGRSGDISLRVGAGNYADGGDVYVTAGNASGYSFLGGNLNLQSGLGDVSGQLVDEQPLYGTTYFTQISFCYICVGDVNLISPSSGIKASETSGNINIGTGSSYGGNSGALNLRTGDGAQASSVLIQAGKSTGRDISGGGVLIQGGAGSTSGTYYGGDGGDIHLLGGKSAGNHLLNDRAGNIFLEGGESNGQGYGGSIKLQSGRGSHSGVLELQSLNSDRMRQDSGAMVRMNHTCNFYLSTSYFISHTYSFIDIANS